MHRFHRTVWPGLGVLLFVSLSGCASLTQSLQNQTCTLAPNQPFDVLEIDLAQHDVRLYWKHPDGSPFLTLDRVRAWVAEQGDSLIAATNAGIYEPGYIPTGLFIEDGTEHTPINLADGRGNFFLKPNGVFFLTDDDAHIVEATHYEPVSTPVRYATQSGPLLVSNGVIHAGFTPGSQNCRLRSGIGVRDDGTVILAISNGAVNFHDFATFFRDDLASPNALYLDGAISTLYAPTLHRFENTDQKYAGLLVVLMKKPDTLP